VTREASFAENLDFNDQIGKVFDMDVSSSEKYLKIKDNPSLTYQDLQRIIK
jgi:hypothetical protein